MNALQEQELRILGVAGRQPTMRDRWEAFYRLWRIAETAGIHHQNAAQMAFYALGNGIIDEWVHLANHHGDNLEVHRCLPKEIRRTLLFRERKKRLYGRHYEEWVQRDRDTAAKLREKGIEVTPDEVAETRRKVINELRKRARLRDIELPEDDDALLRLAAAGQKKRR